VQLPVRIRRALTLFRKITGLTAVTSLATSLPQPATLVVLSPPIHPRCAKKLRSIANTPCGEQWLIHVQASRRSQRTHTHTCPIDLRCSCVPIHLGNQLVGVAKLVVDPDTPVATLTTAISVLKLVISGTCQDSVVAVLSQELRKSRQRLKDSQRVHSDSAPGAGEPDAQSVALMDRALGHLRRHYQDPTLSLSAIAAALDCNPRYLTTCFTRIVGERMHTYLITLRVSHACRLLLGADLRLKEIAFASGFSGVARLAGAFRRHVGVTPGEYRRIFASP